MDRYEVAGSLLLCRSCGTGGTRHIVKNFGQQTIDVAEMQTEIFIHETDRHEVAFENNATENCEAARRSSEALARLADAVTHDVRTKEYYACYPRGTAYRDGMVNGMGGNAGDMAGLLGPEAAHALARALAEVARMGRDYEELVQDHNRKTCDDFTCTVWGHLVDAARAIDGQLA